MEKTRLLLWGVLLGGLLGCGHMLEEGDYLLVSRRILKDDCGLAEAPGIFTVGRFRATGKVVAFKYAFFEMQMVGFYLAASERWRVDGNAGNVTWQVKGRECPLDEIRLSLEAETQTPRHFEGTFSLSTHTTKAPECVCELWANVEATRL